MWLWVRIAGLLVVCNSIPMLRAQTLVQQRRADGAMTPLMVYGSAMSGSSCAPLALISHGAGGSERGYAYLAEGLAQRGWLAIVMGHKESGMDVALADIRGKTRHAGLQELVTTPSAYVARMQDIGAGLYWAKTQCKAASGIPFRALLGHSMGGETVMLEAGATNRIGLVMPPVGQDRFDAYVAISSEGPGMVFGDDAWKNVHKPMFVLTGTLDGALNGGPETRKIPFTRLPPDSTRGCHWLGVIDGADHMNFSGRGEGGVRVGAMVVPAVDSFLQGARAGNCALPTEQPGFALQRK